MRIIRDNPQNIQRGDSVIVRQQGYDQNVMKVVKDVRVINYMLCAEFVDGYIGLGGDGIKKVL